MNARSLGALASALFAAGLACAEPSEQLPQPEQSKLAEQPFSARFPVEQLLTREQAQQALDVAAAERERVNAEYEAKDARCLRTFFVNACRDRVRSARAEQLSELRKVEVAARAVQRRLDAEAREARRRADEAQWIAEAPERARREAEARSRYESRQSQAAAAEQRRLGRRPAVGLDKKNVDTPSAPRAPTAQERVENRERYEQKQREAAEYAESKARERADNERRRAEQRAKKAAN